MERQASLLVADEIYYNLHGKAILHGIYHGDLTIPTDPSVSPQLIFFFMGETDVSDPFHTLAVEVKLPGASPVRNPVNVLPPEIVKNAHAGRTRLYYRHPVLITAPVLKPGRIEAKLIHERGEISVTTPWISLNPPPASS
jgi:hypothetical protein